MQRSGHSVNELDQQIAACEADLAAHRQGLRQALGETRQRSRAAVRSPAALIGAAVSGYLLGGIGRRRPRPVPPARARSDPATQASGVAKAGSWSAALGALVVAMVRGQLATPNSWLNQQLADRFARWPGAPHDPAGGMEHGSVDPRRR